METRLNLLKQYECRSLGTEMQIDTEIEFCAALKHNDSIPYQVYEKRGNGFHIEQSGKETLNYYGGSDACQGDSGGPLYEQCLKCQCFCSLSRIVAGGYGHMIMRRTRKI